jgi:hypothetical protein
MCEGTSYYKEGGSETRMDICFSPDPVAKLKKEKKEIDLKRSPRCRTTVSDFRLKFPSYVTLLIEDANSAMQRTAPPVSILYNESSQTSLDVQMAL